MAIDPKNENALNGEAAVLNKLGNYTGACPNVRPLVPSISINRKHPMALTNYDCQDKGRNNIERAYRKILASISVQVFLKKTSVKKVLRGF